MASNVAEKLLEYYAEMVIVDLTLAAKLYSESESEGNPLLLMQSLFHAQQAAEKAFKLFLLVTNLKKLKELKELGHRPLLNTFDSLIKDAKKAITERSNLSELGPIEKRKIKDKIECFEKRIKNIKDKKKETSCYERVKEVLELQLSLSSGLDECLEKLSKLLGELSKRNPEVVEYVYARLALLKAAVQFVRSIVEERPKLKDLAGLKDLVQRGEPLTRDQLEGIIDGVRSTLSWEIIREKFLSMLENPKAWLDQAHESLPVDRQQCFIENLREVCEDPRKMLQLFTVEEQFPGKIAKAINLLTAPIALGDLPLPNGKRLLDHVVSLDVFSECGRYVEAGDGEITPELLAKKKDVARLLVFAAELWTIILIGICTMISAVRKETERKAA